MVDNYHEVNAQGFLVQQPLTPLEQILYNLEIINPNFRKVLQDYLAKAFTDQYLSGYAMGHEIGFDEGADAAKDGKIDNDIWDEEEEE